MSSISSVLVADYPVGPNNPGGASGPPPPSVQPPPPPQPPVEPERVHDASGLGRIDVRV